MTGYSCARTRRFGWGAPLLLLLLALGLLSPTSAVVAQSSAGALVRTESPRGVLQSYRALAQQLEEDLDAYRQDRSAASYAKLLRTVDTMTEFLDLSDVPIAVRTFTAREIVGHTLDVLARVPEFDAATVPGPEDLPLEGSYLYRIEGSPLRLWRVESGARKGEILFDPHSVANAARYAADFAALPRRPGLGVESWTETIASITGPSVPQALVNAMPEAARIKVLDTPLWKVVTALVVALLAASALVLWHRGLALVAREGRLGSTAIRLLGPAAVALVSQGLTNVLTYELNLFGRLSGVVHSINAAIIHITLAWIAWILVRAVFQRAAARLDGRPDSIDVNMLNLVGQILAALAAIVVIVFGAQSLGLPVLSILAGFGIGGIAIALAIRPTFENLIGGFILYLDRPIRVGDFCTFGGLSGTVERIGVRSTQVRALDRTLITVPNAQFADMQLINWASCDKMMIATVLGLRYETDTDVLRFVLARIRRMLHAHPRIDNDTIRVRFAGYGAHSLDIDLRVYALTREWNDFFAIREDVLLRIAGIVEEAGTGFAFPSQTVYLSRDSGLDDAALDRARAETAEWRQARRFPFPRFSSEELKRVEDTLPYPPPGSPEFMADAEELSDGAETLSAHPVTPVEEPDEKEKAS